MGTVTGISTKKAYQAWMGTLSVAELERLAVCENDVITATGVQEPKGLAEWRTHVTLVIARWNAGDVVVTSVEVDSEESARVDADAVQVEIYGGPVSSRPYGAQYRQAAYEASIVIAWNCGLCGPRESAGCGVCCPADSAGNRIVLASPGVSDALMTRIKALPVVTDPTATHMSIPDGYAWQGDVSAPRLVSPAGVDVTDTGFKYNIPVRPAMRPRVTNFRRFKASCVRKGWK